MSLDRRKFFSICARMGFGSTLLPGALYTLAAQSKTCNVTPEMIDEAGLLAGVTIAPEQKKAMLSVMEQHRTQFDEVRALKMPNSVPPAFVFDPMPPGQTPAPPPAGADFRKALRMSPAPAIAARDVPNDLNELAFCSVRELGELVWRKKVSSTDLTRMYPARLKKYDPQRHFVINLTEERALAQAKEADKGLAAGKYRGPLHGIPWGAKDLTVVRGYPTTRPALILRCSMKMP